jgi:hypothetical protein
MLDFECLALQILAQQAAKNGRDVPPDVLIGAFVTTTQASMRWCGATEVEADVARIREGLNPKILRACHRWANPSHI